MITWNDLKHLDVAHLGLTKLDLGVFDVLHIDLPKFEMPNIDLPKFDLPAAGFPELDRMAGLARDAAYAGVGAAGVTVRKLDEQRRDVTDQVTARVRRFVDTVV